VPKKNTNHTKLSDMLFWITFSSEHSHSSVTILIGVAETLWT